MEKQENKNKNTGAEHASNTSLGSTFLLSVHEVSGDWLQF